MASILPQLLGDGNYMDILFNLVGNYFEGSPYGPLIKQYGKKFLESEQGVMVMNGFNNVLANVAVSESGQRFVKLMPQLMVTKDLQSLLEVQTTWPVCVKGCIPEYLDSGRGGWVELGLVLCQHWELRIQGQFCRITCWLCSPGLCLFNIKYLNHLIYFPCRAIPSYRAHHETVSCPSYLSWSTGF